MLLAVNVGNTTISLGLFKGRELMKHWRWPTKRFTSWQVRKLASSMSSNQIKAIIIRRSRVINHPAKQIEAPKGLKA